VLASRHKIPDVIVRVVNSVENAINIGIKKFGSNATISIIPEGL